MKRIFKKVYFSSKFYCYAWSSKIKIGFIEDSHDKRDTCVQKFETRLFIHLL